MLFLSDEPESFHVFLTHDWGMDSKGRNNHSRVAEVCHPHHAPPKTIAILLKFDLPQVKRIDLHHQVCSKLKARGIQPWFDNDRMTGEVPHKMAKGIDDSKCVAVFVTSRYFTKVCECLALALAAASV